MKAISLHQPWASLIAEGRKTIETRRWQTSHRGPLLICSTKLPIVQNVLGLPKVEYLPTGQALCVAEVVDCRRMLKSDQEAALVSYQSKLWAWELKDVRPIEPFEVRGYQRLYEVDDNLVLVAVDCRNCNGISRPCEVDGLCLFDAVTSKAG
jgi:hypothetical protein